MSEESLVPDRVSDSPASAADERPGASAESAQSTSILGRRRRFLVDPRSQLRTSALVMVTSLALVVLLNLSLHSARTQGAASVLAFSPDLEEVLTDQNRLETFLVAGASVFFLFAVFLMTILETHKTAGPVRNLVRQMDRIESGDYSARLQLRRGDNLRELEGAFNGMSRALREQAAEDVDELRRWAEMARRISGPDDARALADTLSAAAEARRAQG